MLLPNVFLYALGPYTLRQRYTIACNIYILITHLRKVNLFASYLRHKAPNLLLNDILGLPFILWCRILRRIAHRDYIQRDQIIRESQDCAQFAATFKVWIETCPYCAKSKSMSR